MKEFGFDGVWIMWFHLAYEELCRGEVWIYYLFLLLNRSDVCQGQIGNDMRRSLARFYNDSYNYIKKNQKHF